MPGEVFDAIVVGTGFGGAVTACRLAQTGLHVCVLERGRRYDLSSIPALPKDGQTLPDARRWTWAGSQGLWDIRNLDGVTVAQSAAYGGGSLIYANVHLRPPQSVFEEGWPASFNQRRGQLDRYYDLVGSMLEIQPVPAPWRTSGKVKVMSEAFRDAAHGIPRGQPRPPAGPPRAMHPNVFFPPLAIRFPADASAPLTEPPPPPREETLPLNRYGRPQGPCVRCGACDFGCRYGAKNTLDRNYLAVAEGCREEPHTRAVTVKTLAEVLTVSWNEPEKQYTLVYKDHLLDTNDSISARYVFLCAGAVNTTELLLRSQHQASEHQAGRAEEALGAGLTTKIPEVGKSYFINADAPAMIFGANQETFPSAGPVITSALYFDGEHVPGAPVRKVTPRKRGVARERSWFLIEDGGYPQAVARFFSVFQTPALLGRNAFDADLVPRTVLTAARAATTAPRPDRYPSLLDGFAAAFVAGTLPDVLPTDFNTASASLKNLARTLRDAEVGDLAEEVRDAVLLNSDLFRRLKSWEIDRLWPWLWQKVYQIAVRWMRIDRKELLGSTLDATHHRYGVDKPRELPSRLAHLLLNEPYPVNPPQSAFGDPKSPAPAERPQAMLLAMGRDDLPATLELKDARLLATFPNEDFPTLGEEERVMRGIADQLGGTLRSNPLWALARRPITAHSHGGCALGAVTDEWGEVHGYPNLFINDGSLLPRPVGVNPSSTIAAIAERNVEHFVLHRYRDGKGNPVAALPPDWQSDIDGAAVWKGQQGGVALEPPLLPVAITLNHEPVGFTFKEAMSGFMSPVDAADPASKLPAPGRVRIQLAPFLVAEQRGRTNASAVSFAQNAKVEDLGAFLEDPHHKIPLRGPLELGPGLLGPDRHTVNVAGGSLNLLLTVAPGKRLMLYHLPFRHDDQDWTLVGHKEIQDDPGFDAWLDASTLYVELWSQHVPVAHFVDVKGDQRPGQAHARGILRLGLRDFLDNQVSGLHATGTDDPARTIWTLGSFGFYFFGKLQGVYAPEIDRFLELFGNAPWRKGS